MTRTRGVYKGRLGSMEDLPTGGSRPSLCVAYLVLSGTSAWALKQTSTSATYAFGAFSFLLGHSLIGFLHATHPEPPNVITKLFRQTSIIAEVAPLALLNAELYLMSGFNQEYAYVHVISAFLPTFTDMILEENTQTLLDISLIGNLASLVHLHLSKQTGVWTGGLIALTALNHYVFKQVAHKYNVPRIEIVTIGLTFFTVFGLNCLRDLKG